MIINAAKHGIIQNRISIFIRNVFLSLFISVSDTVSKIQNMDILTLIIQTYSKILHSKISIYIIQLVYFLNSI